MSAFKNVAAFGSVAAFSSASSASGNGANSNSGSNVVSAFSNLGDLSAGSAAAAAAAVPSVTAVSSSAVKFKAASFAVPNESSMSAVASESTPSTTSSNANSQSTANSSTTALTSNLSGLAAKLAAAKRVKPVESSAASSASTNAANASTASVSTPAASSIASLLAANAAAAAAAFQPEQELKSFSAVVTASANQDSDAFKGGSLVFDAAGEKAEKAGAQPASPPPKVEAHTGEENETTAFQARATLFVLHQSAAQQNEWRERGNGNLKVNLQKGGRARLLLRQEGSLKVILNASLQYKMPYITVGERAVRFIVCDTSTDDHRPQSWLARFGRVDEAESLMGALRMALVTVPKPAESESGETTSAGLSGKKRSLEEEPRQAEKKSIVETNEGEAAEKKKSGNDNDEDQAEQ